MKLSGCRLVGLLFFGSISSKGLIYLLCLWSMLLVSLSAHTENKPKKTTLGWLEIAYLQPDNAKIKAKLDTGAKTSSLHAVDIQYMEKDSKPWVRFHTPIEIDKKIETVIFELPVLQSTRIKEHTGTSQIRYVVELAICLNGEFYRFSATLADRSNFNYELLLGRNVLAGRLLVDAGRSFTANKQCVEHTIIEKEVITP